MSNIVRGTMLLTAATFLSKFLGMIYVIPFNELVGERGGALFSFAYTPYNILLSVSTIGVPLAVSKFVSKYNSLGDYETGMRMFKLGMKMLLITGLAAFVLLFFSAEPLARLMLANEDSTGISIADVTMVIRMVSFALIVIPAMSIVRGFFQGYQSMGPTAISQVVEQIVRIVFLLAAAFAVMKVYQGGIATAVGFATFAAFVGALASCFVLFLYWKKRKANIIQQVEQQQITHDISKKDLLIELFSYAGPFVLVGLATPLYQLVDQFTFKRAMLAIGQNDVWDILYGAINFYGHKLVIIPVTIATGLSLAIIPALTKSFTIRDQNMVSDQINQALQIILVLVVPAAAGLGSLSEVAYGTLFGLENIDITGTILAWYAPVALLFALFTVSAAILQGINQQKFAVVSLTAGLLMKILFNVQLIHMFGAKGAIFGTGLAVGTAVVLNIWKVKVSIDFSFKRTNKIALLTIIFSAMMVIAVLIIKNLLGIYLPYMESRTAAAIVLFAAMGVGGLLYLYLGYKSTLLERVLGKRVNILHRIFRKRSV